MGSFRMTVGAVEIVALTDMNLVFPMPLKELWAQVPLEAWKPYREKHPDTFAGDYMRLEIGCYLVRSQSRTILIDTGYGDGPIESIGGLRGQLMADLASKKVRPDEVDLVFLSHLHSDHVGWNTTLHDGQVRPTFPDARYVVHQADWHAFRKPVVQARFSFPYIDRCVESLDRLGMLDVIAEDHNLTSDVRVLHTPGHTPGHMSVLVASQGQRALIQGDVLIHPAQVTEPDWNCHFDMDWATATQTRKRLLDLVEADRMAVLSCHFPFPGFGQVIRVEGRRYWQVGLSLTHP
jgi:glyoxylase-like metal-dependent hydrolase (beta-lactamase superfamily II)